MKIEKIADNTIRITLNRQDFETRNIDASKLKVNSPAYQQLLWDIIEHAEIEFGFDVMESQIIVETVTDKAGDYVVTITRTEENPDEDFLPDFHQQLFDRIFDIFKGGFNTDPAIKQNDEKNSEKKDLTLRRIRKPLSMDELPAESDLRESDLYDIIYFSNFENLISLCQAFPQCKIIPSSLYSYKSGYYLVLKISKRHLTVINRLESGALEFDGLYVSPEIFYPILEEHGSKIIKRGAISSLLRTFFD